MNDTVPTRDELRSKARHVRALVDRASAQPGAADNREDVERAARLIDETHPQSVRAERLAFAEYLLVRTERLANRELADDGVLR